PAGEVLRSFDAGAALAVGWTEGYLRGTQAERCFDPVTGLCTVEVFRLRLNQVFDQCRSIGLEPNWLYRVVVVDTELGLNGESGRGLGRFEADAAMVVLAGLLQRHFTTGETISRAGGRIFVLANNTDDLHDRASTISALARDRSLLRAVRVIAWIEDLPATVRQLDDYIADLSV
ncbi:MAG TPA: hypothetical protein PLV68_02260, partial [Ilumatobacteraceae bacterium]|nr:hypothetical protein [Ilumatobacteraceae bacterium]